MNCERPSWHCQLCGQKVPLKNPTQLPSMGSWFVCDECKSDLKALILTRREMMKQPIVLTSEEKELLKNIDDNENM